MSEQNQEDSKSVALIIIGNEILSGRTADANVQHIGTSLFRHGLPLQDVRMVPDIEEKIIEAVNDFRKTYDYVFTTGGIGPTHDDITARCVAKAFGVGFGRNEGAYKILMEYYGEEGINDNLLTMADMPEGVSLIKNSATGAPGFRIGNVFVMAGIPRIMQAMLVEVLEELPLGPQILSNTITCDLVESMIATGLDDIQQNYPRVEIGSYPYARGGINGVSLVLRSTDPEALKPATAETLSYIREKGGEPMGVGLQVAID